MVSIHQDRHSIRAAIDLSDHADVFYPVDCDLYFKRNLKAPVIPVSRSGRVLPFGLNYACSSWASRRILFGRICRNPRTRYRNALIPHWRTFEHPPDALSEPSILFQTRLWDPEDAPGDEGINDERIDLARALKKHFGSRVIGGVIPTPYAIKRCPEVLSEHPGDQPRYVRWAKKSRIGIYFRGLFDSVAFKMAEYLAGAKCIIAEPLRNELPEPLVPGHHILAFNNVEECLAACESALCRPDLMQSLSYRSWQYYEREVRPLAHAARLVERALCEYLGASK